MKIAIIMILVCCGLLIGTISAEMPIYGNWTEITSNANFSPRYDFGATTFNDQLWVIGGHIQKGYFWGCSGNSTCDKNDVWSSPDGHNWTLVTDNAGFSPRPGPGVAVFHDRLWVIGGGTFGNMKNDVWSSSDGITWILETDNAGFSPRGDMGVAVFDNRLWVIAGGEYPNLKNDVWSSPDGKSWTQVTANAEFSPRFGKGVVAFGNKLWIIGGISDSEYTDPVTDYTYISEGGSKDVWSSTNGKNWTLVTADAPFKYLEFTPVTTFDNKIWIVGGGNWITLTRSPKPYIQPHAFSEIWSSPDGSNWTLEHEDAGFSPRFLHGVAVFQNGIWVLGGTDNGGISGDVWYMPLPVPTQTPATTVPLSSNISSTVPAVQGTPAQAGIDPLTVGISLLIVIGTGYCVKRG
jgi:hypothetical protein